MYTPNNGGAAPQQDFNEGLFIDYRHFDQANIEPVFEFGFGLSYTTFNYSNLQVEAKAAPPYTPNTGMTKAAPVLGNFSTNPNDYTAPGTFPVVPLYVYPYLDGQAVNNMSSASVFPPHAQDGSPQAVLPAGGAPGGNPGLYDVLFTVTADIENCGKVDGDEVVQLYVCRGGANDPVRELRNFDRLSIPAGGKAHFSVDITRRDISNWDPASQNWVISSAPKTVYVGSSSRLLPLKAALVVAS